MGDKDHNPPKIQKKKNNYKDTKIYLAALNVLTLKNEENLIELNDDIRQVAGVTWNRVAKERHEWKRLEEAFADWQTDLHKIRKIQIRDYIKVYIKFKFSNYYI